jgi:hypothetical protein
VTRQAVELVGVVERLLGKRCGRLAAITAVAAIGDDGQRSRLARQRHCSLVIERTAIRFPIIWGRL